jgi:hypothetical protein
VAKVEVQTATVAAAAAAVVVVVVVLLLLLVLPVAGVAFRVVEFNEGHDAHRRARRWLLLQRRDRLCLFLGGDQQLSLAVVMVSEGSLLRVGHLAACRVLRSPLREVQERIVVVYPCCQ